MTKGLSIEELNGMRADVFAPMVQDLDIVAVEISPDGARFEIPASQHIMRVGDVVCGQALAAIADTVGVLTLFGHNEERRIMTTVDMTTHFMRPLSGGMLEAVSHIQSNGKRMANVRVEIRQKGSSKAAATTTCAYVYV